MSTQATTVDAPRRARFDAVVEVNRRLCREHYLLRLRINANGPSFPATRPGQFIQLGCRKPDFPADAHALGCELEWTPDGLIDPSTGRHIKPTQPEIVRRLALLRRPFSLSGRGEDPQGTWIEIVHRVVGAGTAWLEQLTPGQAVDLIGPLGNAFEVPPHKRLALLVGGGVGLPPMFYLAEAIKAAGMDAVAFVGALTRDLLAVTPMRDITPDPTGKPTLFAQEFARLGFGTVVTTDDGSLGLKGRITAGVESFLRTLEPDQAERVIVYTCGPEPMMHAVGDLAAGRRIDCHVCLEQAMACGMGTCQSCIVRIEDRVRPQASTPAPESRPWRYRLACTDGPVFPASQVVW